MKDYFGTAMMDLERIESASDEEFVSIAIENKVDLRKYEVE